MDLIWGGLVVFFFRMVQISMTTVRMLLTVRGQKILVALVGFVETLIYILIIGQVIREVGNYWNVLGYCAGFTAGTLVGAFIEEKLALGFAIVRLISVSNGQEIADALREGGFGATEVLGRGKESPVHVIETVVARKDVPTVMSCATEVDSKVFVTVEEIRNVYRGFLSGKGLSIPKGQDR